MARPKKHPHERRSATVRSDLTLAEKCYVQQQAALAGLTEAEYTRRRVLGYTVRAVMVQPSGDAALVTEINGLGLQLSALGNLANQIARYCHTERDVPLAWADLPHDIKDLLRLVEQTLQRMLAPDDPQNP